MVVMRKQTVNQAWSLEALSDVQAENSARHDVGFQRWQQAELHAFIDQGFPTRQHENWKYTNVSGIAEQTFSLSTPLSVLEDIHSLMIPNTHTIVFVNGHYAPQLSKTEDVPSGLVISTVKTALMNKSLTLLKVLKEYQTPFSLLNSALMTDGLFLSVPAGVSVKRPIHLLYINTSSERASMNHPRHVIDVGENSHVTLFEDYYGDTDVPYFNNVVTQVDVAEQASVQYYKLQRESKDAFHIANTVITQHKSSTVSSYNLSVGACLGRDDLNIDLKESGASCQLLGLYYLNDQRHIDQHGRIDHRVPQCSSQQNYKGIVDGKSRAVFNGKVMVHAGAQQTSAHQSNKNLLLSKTAEINTKPELEIYADDVQCTHGATVGQLDEKALFYLRSRGIDDATAHHLLTCAFANEILDQLPASDIATALTTCVVGRLATPGCCGGCHYE